MGAVVLALLGVIVLCVIVMFGIGFFVTYEYPERNDKRRNAPIFVVPAMIAFLVGILAVLVLAVIGFITLISQ